MGRLTGTREKVASFAEQGFRNVTGLTAGHYVHSRGSGKNIAYGSQSIGVGRVLWARMAQGDVVVNASISRYDVPDVLGQMRQMNFAFRDPRYEVLGVTVELSLEHATAESLEEDLTIGRNYLRDFRSYVRVGKTGRGIAEELRGNWSEAKFISRVAGVRLSLSRDLETPYSRLRLEMPFGLFAIGQRSAARELAQVAARTLEKILRAKPN